MNMIRKGQIQGVSKGDIMYLVKFIADIFRSCWINKLSSREFYHFKYFLQHNHNASRSSPRPS